MSKKTKTILLVILCAILVLAAGASFYLMSMLRKVNRTEPTKDSEPDTVETVQTTSVPISSVSITEPDIGDKEEKNIRFVYGTSIHGALFIVSKGTYPSSRTGRSCLAIDIRSDDRYNLSKR